MQAQKRPSGYRSLFWPVLLIGAGLIWLLSNMGILSLSPVNLSVLLRLWPILLIVLGLDLLIGRKSPVWGAFLGFGAAALVLVLVLAGPSLGVGSRANIDIQTDYFSAPIGQAKKAKVELDLAVGEVSVHPLSDSKDLIDAQVTHSGQVEFVTTGEREKRVRLKEKSKGFNLSMFSLIGKAQDLQSDIGLNSNIPLDLDIKLDVGDAALDLSRLQLTDLSVRGDVGQVNLTLPAADHRYTADLKGDVGSFNIEIPKAADIDLDINGDVGGFVIKVPPDAGVRVEARVDVGGVDLSSRFVRLQGGNDDFIGERGVWETRNFDNADRNIWVVFKGDVGGLEVR